MARTALTSQNISYKTEYIVNPSGSVDATNGMQFTNTGKELIIFKNGGASSVTLTINYATDQYGRGGSVQKSVAAGTTILIGPFPLDAFGQSVAVDCGTATNTNIQIIHAG